MLPIINLFGRQIPTYGLMGTIGALSGLFYVFFRSPRYHLSRDDAVYIYVLSLVGAMIGAKILYLALEAGDLIQDLPLLLSNFSMFFSKYLTGGFVFYGGLFSSIAVAWLCARNYRVHLVDFFPVLLPALALMCGFGRIGCFCAGCCYGVETSSPLGVVFPRTSHIAPAGIPLVPVQLIEAAADFLLFFFMIWLCKKASRTRYALRIYLLLYAAIRFTIEFWRGDSIRGLWGPFSTSQWISLGVITTVGLLLILHPTALHRETSKNQGIS
jgi:phosphatidylglycerol:prolipoprotein diacylglycerol transferase